MPEPTPILCSHGVLYFPTMRAAGILEGGAARAYRCPRCEMTHVRFGGKGGWVEVVIPDDGAALLAAQIRAPQPWDPDGPEGINGESEPRGHA